MACKGYVKAEEGGMYVMQGYYLIGKGGIASHGVCNTAEHKSEC